MKLKDVATLAFGSRQDKEPIMYRHVKKIAKRYGFNLISSHMVWKDQPFFLDARKRAAGVAGINDMRCSVLQNCIRSVATIEGDVAECGVRQGRSTIFMLSADPRRRTYHLFDSFAGLSEPAEDDRDDKGNLKWVAGDLKTDEALTRRNLSSFDNVEFHVGWIPDTLPAVQDKMFALVHIDVDLYEPTRDSLAFFYDRTRHGGLIVCDDYGSAKCPGARKAFDEFLADRPEGLIELPTGQAIICKR